MGSDNKEIAHFDVSASSIPLALKLAESGYRVKFVTYDECVATQLNEYSFYTHRMSRAMFAKLKTEGRILSTTDVEGTLASTKRLLIPIHGVDGELKNKKVLITNLSKIVKHISAGTILLYCGISPPGTMLEIINVVNRFSRLQVGKDVYVSMMTYPMLDLDRYVVCSTDQYTLRETKDIVCKILSNKDIDVYDNFLEAEVANIANIAKRILMKTLSLYLTIVSKELDVDLNRMLVPLKLPQLSIFEDYLYDLVLKYLISNEIGVQRHLTLMRNAILIRKMYLEMVKQAIRKKLRSMLSGRKKILQIFVILESLEDKELIESILPRRNVNIHYIDIDELLLRYEDRSKRIVPSRVNLILLATRSFKPPEELLKMLNEEAEVIDLNNISIHRSF